MTFPLQISISVGGFSLTLTNPEHNVYFDIIKGLI